MIKIAHTDLFCHAVPDGHRFPMAKYRLLPKKLLLDGIVTPAQFFTPSPASDDEILSTHCPHYWQQLSSQTLSAKDARAIGLPMSPELVLRERYVVHATYECALHALTDGVSLSTSGGTHHASYARGEGFCLLNDICIASNLLLARKQARRVLIIDLDVHQGNGSATLMANNPDVFTFSMHGAKNYPFYKPPSDLDIALATGTGDDDYLNQLIDVLPSIVAHARPDVIFYQAGVDVLAADSLGKLNLSSAGCYQRDVLVFEHAYHHGIPVTVVMGGGYAPDIDTIVHAHSQTFFAAMQRWG